MRPVPEYDAKSWLIKALRETAHAMESLLWDVGDDAEGADGVGPGINRRPGEDEWSCRELIRHMCEMERRYTDRLERMARMDAPAIAAFDADSIEAELDDGDDAVFDMMDEFSVQRRQSVYLLWSLDDDDWRRTGIHPYLGELTIMQVAREMNEHDLAHLWQLRRLCDRYEAAPA